MSNFITNLACILCRELVLVFFSIGIASCSSPINSLFGQRLGYRRRPPFPAARVSCFCTRPPLARSRLLLRLSRCSAIGIGGGVAALVSELDSSKKRTACQFSRAFPHLFARPALRNPDFRKSCENMPESHTYSLWGFLGPRRDCSVDWASAKSGRERGGFCSSASQSGGKS